MEIIVGFTVMPGNEGWQFPPIQYRKTYKAAENAHLEAMKTALQEVMDFAETKLAPFKEASKDDQLILALKALSGNLPKLENK